MADGILTVKDALNHSMFKKARVVAGKGGLYKRIRWVHILEISNFETLIHGEEMILATGIGLQSTISSKADYLKKLISHGATCLCIEIGHYFDSVSDELISIANEHDFPIIEFRETVRFIDITQEFHALIINSHHKMLSELEQVAFKFNQLTLSSKGVTNILRLLSETLNVQVIFSPSRGKAQFVPLVEISKQEALYNVISQKLNESGEEEIVWREDGKGYILQTVEAMGQVWGFVCLVSDRVEPGDFEKLVLDRAVLAIAQDVLRKRYIEERKLHNENLWVSDLIHNRIKDPEQVKMQLGIGMRQTHIQARVCLLEIANLRRMETELMEDDAESLRIHIALIARAIFEKNGLKPVMTTNFNQLVIIAIQYETETLLKDKLQKILDGVKTMIREKKLDEVDLHIGVGREVNELTDSHLSYEQAQQVLKVILSEGGPKSYFYEDMGVFRLLLPFGNGHIMKDFIYDHIGPIIDYDREKGTKLLKTLKVFLDHKGSKQESAEQLFIVRQTLYHRLEKIKDLIGVDFMVSDKRLSIEMALRAHQLLKDGQVAVVQK